MSGRVPVAVCLLALTACYSVARYRGPGRLHDAGPLAAYQRFWLDLGRLEEVEESDYRLSGLPGAVFTLGVQVESLDVAQARREAERFGVVAELTLLTADGALVIDERAPLTDWVWTCGNALDEVAVDCGHSFAYRTGESRELTFNSGETGSIRVGERLDGGWGTFFEPRRRETYRLRVRLEHGRAFADRHRLRVVANGR